MWFKRKFINLGTSILMYFKMSQILKRPMNQKMTFRGKKGNEKVVHDKLASKT